MFEPPYHRLAREFERETFPYQARLMNDLHFSIDSKQSEVVQIARQSSVLLQIERPVFGGGRGDRA